MRAANYLLCHYSSVGKCPWPGAQESFNAVRTIVFVQEFESYRCVIVLFVAYWRIIKADRKPIYFYCLVRDINFNLFMIDANVNCSWQFYKTYAWFAVEMRGIFYSFLNKTQFTTDFKGNIQKLIIINVAINVNFLQNNLY